MSEREEKLKAQEQMMAHSTSTPAQVQEERPNDKAAGQEMPIEEKPAIGVDEIKKAMDTLKKYKRGKANLEERIVKNEQWWKMRHWNGVGSYTNEYDPKPASGWLFNCIISKHADFMDSYPAPAILPREMNDRQEAQKLSSIIPVVLEQNDFESVYSQETYYKLKNGTGCYGVFWDSSKLNGLGDITIKSIDLLSLYWEPGITDIQKSRNLFYVQLVDNEALEESYPETKGKLGKGRDNIIKKYIFEDHIDTSDKSFVVDWYYKKHGKLHFCKFVNEIVLYASENDTKTPMKSQLTPVQNERGQQVLDEEGLPMLAPREVPAGPSIAQRGWYDHGLYPFVLDVLFPEEGMPVGFGFVDVCKNAQMSIDILNNAIEKNAVMNATPRYFYRGEGSINEEEFMDPSQTLVHVSGNLGDDSIRPIDRTTLDGIYLNILNSKIDELKETSGNRDTANGGTTAGVTAASAIAAMQEQSGKASRDMIKTTYRAYRESINLVIELIRQFYDLPRQFRIIGDRGKEEYVEYTNAGIQPEYQGNEFGVDMGYRLPVFDIKVAAMKENAYSQLSQNELALQFYNSGFFNPQFTDQVLACMDMMEFQGKDEVIQKIERNGTMFEQIQMLQQRLLQMSQIIDQLQGTKLTQEMAAEINGEAPPMGEANVSSGALEGDVLGGESKHMAKAREQSNNSTAPR